MSNLRASVPPTNGPQHDPARAVLNPAPLSLRQLHALAAAITRELFWGLPNVAREIRGWRRLAAAIPDDPIRQDALAALQQKRGQADGAAFFSILPKTRDPVLLRLLVAYQIIWDFLDSTNERGAAAGQQNGRQLHLALVDALTPGAPLHDYYQHHPWHDDGGYLETLVMVCRDCCDRLPSFSHVRRLVVREARRAEVLAINHDPNPAMRDRALTAWVALELPEHTELSWYELSGAASAGLTIFALLTLASDPNCRVREIHATCHVYYPWTAALATMLDSYVDQQDDRITGDHVYIGHYPSPTIAAQRVGYLMRRSLQEAGKLEAAEKHILIATCMVALYLSKDSARSAATRNTTLRLAASGGTLTRLLLPTLRLWRVIHGLRSI